MHDYTDLDGVIEARMKGGGATTPPGAPSIARHAKPRRGAPTRIPGAPVDPDSLTLQQLQHLLSSDEHYSATQTRNYGLVDPLGSQVEMLFPCTCGARPRVARGAPPIEARVQYRPLPPGSEARAYHVACGACGKAAQPSLREWRAVIDWNFLHAASQAGSLERFPFFNVTGLVQGEAVKRLNSIKRDLLLRRALARKQRDQGMEVGGRFLAKIEAYIGWVNVALKIATR